MNNIEFVEKLKSIRNSNTIYMTGTFGQLVTHDLINQKSKQYPNAYSELRKANLRSLVGKNYHAFDCIGLVKAVLWGYPNVSYASNGVPDINDQMVLSYLLDLSTNMNKIEVGELLHKKGHVGVYVGNGIVVECTTDWSGNVLFSSINQRKWKRHGKLCWITYGSSQNKEECYKMNTLKYGSIGNDVTIFETIMKKMGYYNGEIDTHFGNGCVQACNKFQTKYPECGTNGKPDSSFGPKCWNKALSLLKG